MRRWHGTHFLFSDLRKGEQFLVRNRQIRDTRQLRPFAHTNRIVATAV